MPCFFLKIASSEPLDFVIPSQKQWYDPIVAKQKERLKLKARAEGLFSSSRNYLFAASGFRKTGQTPSSQLDWALIEVEKSRVAANRVSNKIKIRYRPSKLIEK